MAELIKNNGRLYRDLTGRVMGRWTVIKYDGMKRYKNCDSSLRMWLCRCSCGVERSVGSLGLLNGRSKSCGCLKKELDKIQKPDHYTIKIRLYREYKNNATKRGYSFSLSFDEFVLMLSKNCFYCNSNTLNQRKAEKLHSEYTYTGIDRIDNKQGYVIGNIVPCCKKCNVAKHTMSQNDFSEWIINVYNNFVKGKCH